MRNTARGTNSRPQAVAPLDFQTMRQNVNESQRKGFSFESSPVKFYCRINSKLGGHAPGGRVTAIPAPSISQQRYPPVTGYSTSHSQHAQETSAWSKRAYKGLNSNQIGTISINLYAYEPTFNAKGQPCIVDVRSMPYISNNLNLTLYTGNQRRHTCQLRYHKQCPMPFNPRKLAPASG